MIYSSKHTDHCVITCISNIFEKDGYLGYLCTSYSYTVKVSSTVIRKAREVAMTVLFYMRNKHVHDCMTHVCLLVMDYIVNFIMTI